MFLICCVVKGLVLLSRKMEVLVFCVSIYVVG